MYLFSMLDIDNIEGLVGHTYDIYGTKYEICKIEEVSEPDNNPLVTEAYEIALKRFKFDLDLIYFYLDRQGYIDGYTKSCYYSLLCVNNDSSSMIWRTDMKTPEKLLNVIWRELELMTLRS